MPVLLRVGIAVCVLANIGLASIYVTAAVVGFEVTASMTGPLFALVQLGALLIGKERLEQSDEAVQKYSTRPPAFDNAPQSLFPRNRGS